MTMIDQEQLKRWRLILGAASEEKLQSFGTEDDGMLDEESRLMDEALAAIYDETSGSNVDDGSNAAAPAKRGWGLLSPKLAKWLGDIRTFFPPDVVSVIQSDAIERKGLKQLLFEPELLSQVKPDIQMVATLMALKGKNTGENERNSKTISEGRRR